MAEQLSQQHHLTALDLPWRPNSSHHWPRYGDAAGWLERGLEALSRPPDLIVAHSFGGCALLQLLVRQGQDFPAPAALVAPVLRRHDTPMHPAFFAEAVSRFRRTLAEGLTVRLGPRADRMTPELLAIMVRKMIERVEPEGFLQFYLELSRLAGCDPARIAVPLLLVSDTDDPAAPRRDVQDLRRRVPGLRVRQAPGLGHFCQVEQPEYVASQLVEFLTELRTLPLAPPRPKEMSRA